MNHAVSARALAVADFDGDGVPRDYVLTFRWTDLAAHGGDAAVAAAAASVRDEAAANLKPGEIAAARDAAQR